MNNCEPLELKERVVEQLDELLKRIGVAGVHVLQTRDDLVADGAAQSDLAIALARLDQRLFGVLDAKVAVDRFVVGLLQIGESLGRLHVVQEVHLGRQEVGDVLLERIDDFQGVDFFLDFCCC